jgi:CBS domain-containing protein
MSKKIREDKRESGMPGGGAGRKDDVRGSGVYPMSGPLPASDAPLVGQTGWGQGARGAAGFEDHGESEITVQQTTPERCRDIMTKEPVCCLPSDSTEKAARLMTKYDTGMIPVVSNMEDKKLVGVVTDRDLAVTVVADACDPKRTSVESVMSRPPIVCSPDDPYQHALETMERNRIRRVAVVDRSGCLVGVISQADIALRVRDRNQTAEVVEEISRSAA